MATLRAVMNLRGIVVLIFCLAVFDLRKAEAMPPPPPEVSRLDDLRKLVAMVQGTCRGAGIIFHAEAGKLYIVTADHVARKNCETDGRAVEKVQIKLWQAPGATKEGSVVYREARFDVAVVIVESPNLPPESLPFEILGDFSALKKNVNQGQRVNSYVMGYTAGTEWNIQGEPEAVKSVVGDRIRIFSPQFLNYGASGGAIVDDQYRVVGLMQSFDNSTLVGEGLSIDTIIDLLHQARPAFPVSLRPATATATITQTSSTEQPSPTQPAGFQVAYSARFEAAEDLERILQARGQYSSEGGFSIGAGKGLRIAGTHSHSVAWLNCPIAPPFQIDVDFSIENPDTGQPLIFLRGPGYGLSSSSALVAQLQSAKRLALYDHGVLLSPGAIDFPTALARKEQHHLAALVEADAVRIAVDGKHLSSWKRLNTASGPLETFVGLGTLYGATWSDDAVAYRNVVLSTPAEKCLSQERLLDPPSGEFSWESTRAVPAALVLEAKFPGSEAMLVAAEAGEAAASGPGGLLLRGPNALPLVWLKEPIVGDFEAEIAMQYLPAYDSVNFRVFLGQGSLPKQLSGVVLSFPEGLGDIVLRRFSQPPENESIWNGLDKSAVLARSSSYAPINGRPYRLILARVGSKLGVKSNGGVLFESELGDTFKAGQSIFLGVGQIYGASEIQDILVRK